MCTAALALSLAMPGLAACTPSKPPLTAPTTASSPSAPAPSTPPDPLPGLPTDAPATEWRRYSVLRWADGTEVVGEMLDTGTARRAGPDALTVVRRIETPKDRMLTVIDVAADGSALVTESSEREYDDDGAVVPGSVVPTVVRLVGPQGSRVLVGEHRRLEDVYSGRLVRDGAAVWIGQDVEPGTTDDMTSNAYRAPAGRSTGVRIDVPDGIRGVLDDGLVLGDGTFRAWDGKTRNLGLPQLDNAGVAPVVCERDVCPLVLQKFEMPDDNSPSDGSAPGSTVRAHLSYVEDGEITPVLTIEGSGSLVAAYDRWLVVHVAGPDFSIRTWIIDTANRTARYVDGMPEVAVAGSRLVWGADPTWTGDGAVPLAGTGDLHVLDLPTGDLARIIVGDAIVSPVAEGDFIAWVPFGNDLAPGPAAVVARLGEDVP
ncbi:hypothetical protein IGS67_03765 [Flavimobilis sp. GY10621]|uniref:Lipoprotein n=1 Tax=Flavimobilis rhizosphaerae TaxID=2775421 RepID=A0ABR9DNB8_9MICO|nr:hypothetical protein [Flavimobilis rhizosphaerae]MBD9698612.1 hypothetical protein [Flavimobilis rhizosphaerae]